jgi:hypothetical protein
MSCGTRPTSMSRKVLICGHGICSYIGRKIEWSRQPYHRLGTVVSVPTRRSTAPLPAPRTPRVGPAWVPADRHAAERVAAPDNDGGKGSSAGGLTTWLWIADRRRRWRSSGAQHRVEQAINKRRTRARVPHTSTILSTHNRVYTYVRGKARR